MSRRVLEHVGEVELALEAPTEAGLFTQAAEAFAELIRDGGGPRGDRLRFEVSLAVNGCDRSRVGELPRSCLC